MVEKPSILVFKVGHGTTLLVSDRNLKFWTRKLVPT